MSKLTVYWSKDENSNKHLGSQIKMSGVHKKCDCQNKLQVQLKKKFIFSSNGGVWGSILGAPGCTCTALK